MRSLGSVVGAGELRRITPRQPAARHRTTRPEARRAAPADAGAPEPIVSPLGTPEEPARTPEEPARTRELPREPVSSRT
ncbi:hypothetical protein ABZS86_23920 [Streptomyces sp. NPDC005355]|uniref:hypothetical protein n=1 Tax=Streptomyces sp. NPDC005355 TaxID=3157038 RepID=UPI0033BB0B4E